MTTYKYATIDLRSFALEVELNKLGSRAGIVTGQNLNKDPPQSSADVYLH
jgi:hypothetical protein